MTRILLCVGDPITARGLEAWLRRHSGFELLPVCHGVGALTERATKEAPDLLLLDLTPEVSFALMSELRRRLKETRIVLWVKSVSHELAVQAMGLGVRGVLRKQLPAEVQLQCLQRVQAGELWFEKPLDSLPNSRRVDLTSGEEELVGMLAQGMNNQEIAVALGIPVEKLKVELASLFQKVGVKDRFELALFGVKRLAGDQAPAREGKRKGKSSARVLKSLLFPAGCDTVGAGSQTT